MYKPPVNIYFKTYVFMGYFVVLLFLAACKQEGYVYDTPATVEEAESILKSQEKKQIRAAKKAQKEAYKRFWRMQSDEVRASIKRNYKAQKKAYKAKRSSY